MDKLEPTLAFPLIILAMLGILIVFAPSWILFLAALWASKKLIPKQRRWISWGALLAILFVTPQILNLLIEKEVSKTLSENHFQSSENESTRILAVEVIGSSFVKPALCDTECAALLLSGKIDVYLAVSRERKTNRQKVTSFQFEAREVCPSIDFLSRKYSAELRNTIFALGLQGKCLTSSDSELALADTHIKYTYRERRFLLRKKGLVSGYSVSRRNLETKHWRVVENQIGTRYRELRPVLLLAFNHDANPTSDLGLDGNISINFWNRPVLRTKHEKTICSKGILPKQDHCAGLNRLKPVSNILGYDVSEQRLKSDGMIFDRSKRMNITADVVKNIILENRQPHANEWRVINNYILREYRGNAAYADLVVDVISNDNFPMPNLISGIETLDAHQKELVLDVLVKRIVQNKIGPEIGSSDEREQWKSVYSAVKTMPVNFVTPHFEALVNAKPPKGFHYQHTLLLSGYGLNEN